MAVNIAAFPEHFPRGDRAPSSPPRPRSSPRPAARSPAATPSATQEPIFGLAVQGVVDPRPRLPQGAAPGRATCWCCPSRIGTGIALAGGSDADKAAAIAGMRALNRAARRRSWRRSATRVHAVTDVTGYGLAGHGWEMAERSGVRFVVDTARAPLYPGALEAAERGVRTGGDPRNRDYVAGAPRVDGVAAGAEALCMDPQTSGGLLAAIDPAWSSTVTTMWWRGRRGQVGDRRSCCADSPAGLIAAVRAKVGRHSTSIEQELWAPATTSSSASTRSGAARGPGR